MGYALITLILIALETAYLTMARRFGIVDEPNDRSSHSRAVVRGGGIVFFFGSAAWWIWSGCSQWEAMLAFAILAAVSFIDDLREVSVAVRLAVQLAASALICWQTMNLESPLLRIMAIIVGTGIMNGFNFMDGINGSVGLYTLIVLLSCAYINIYVVPDFMDQRLLTVSAIAAVIFCVFNFRTKALCFAGDVGSIVAGAIVFYALARLIYATGNIGWLVLVAVYGVDVVMTLFRRLFKRQNIFRAHRMHAYQLASNELGAPQLAVSGVLAGAQAVIDIPALAWGVSGLPYLVAMSVMLAAIYFLIVAIAPKS